jgi:hypothetical protein
MGDIEASRHCVAARTASCEHDFRQIGTVADNYSSVGFTCDAINDRTAELVCNDDTILMS